MRMRKASALGAAFLFFAAVGAAQEKKLACPERAEGREHRVCEMREMNVDLPALGRPSRPASAKTLSSRRMYFSTPGSPG